MLRGKIYVNQSEHLITNGNCFLSVIGANAATYTVTKVADTNDGTCDADCSLREAIAAANGTTADDTIVFDAGVFASAQTITLGGTELTVNSTATAGTLTITGTGASLLTVSGNNQSRIFNVTGGADLRFSGMTITGGGAGAGGGIINAGILTVTNSTVRNSAANGGGGIFNTGVAIVTNSTISNNTALNGGGGGVRNSGTMTVTNSTISGNSVSVDGGGIYNNIAGSIVNLTNSTISGNSSNNLGGGVFNDSGGVTVNSRNSIIAGNSATNSGPDFFGTLTSQGYNLIGNIGGASISGDTTGNILNQNARLAPLGFYGGTMETHALLSNSPAVNAGDSANVLPLHQRGAARVGNVDMGAFELNNSANGGNYFAELPRGQTGMPYNYTLVPNNGAFTYSQTGGSLPNGIALNTMIAPNTVVALGGTATMGGIYDFAVTATDGVNSNVTNYRVQFVAPVAANVSVSGRVMAQDGRSLQNAIVTMTDSSGNIRSYRTGTFGYFVFEDVEVGQTYVFQVQSKRFTFAPQILTVNEEFTELNFTAQ